MTLIEFTRNHNDKSTDKGFQFEFLCDRCGNGFETEFQASATGMASSALRAAGSLFGGFLNQAGNSAYEIERAIQGPAHDHAFRAAIDEAKPNFRQCPRCTHWVCLSSCWNSHRALCFDCSPDLEVELASEQTHAAVDQMKEKVRAQDLTKGLDLTSEAAAVCPACGARTQGAKFCPECGQSLRPKNECAKCGTKFEAGTKFCPECGTKVE
jgi:membrane protease subunit (stomatin/prohibitin family)